MRLKQKYKRKFKSLSIIIIFIMSFTFLGANTSFAAVDENSNMELQEETSPEKALDNSEKPEDDSSQKNHDGERVSQVKENDVITVDEIKYRILTQTAGGGTVALGADLGWQNPSVPKDIEKFTIPKKIQYEGKSYTIVKIGTNAFMDCAKLKEIKIPDTVEEIGEGAFRRNYSLKSVSMTPSVKKMGASVFSLCEELQQVELSDNITSIGEGSFSGCSSLGTITLPSKLKEIASELFGSSGIMSIRIPKAVKKIGESAFWRTESLSNVIFEEGSNCKGIAAKAFEFSAVRNVALPEATTTIGTKAFNQCRNLKSFGLEKTGGHLVVVGENAFSSTDLREFTISGTMREFYPSALASCKSLQKVNVSEFHPNFAAEKGVLYNKNKTILFIYPKAKTGSSFDVPDSVRKIHYEAFSQCQGLESVKLPDTLEFIGASSFFQMRNLEEIHIPASVKSVGKMAFGDCESLGNVQIEEGVAEISEYAFYKLPMIKTVEIPSSVKKIEVGVFSDCPALEKIVLKSRKYTGIALGAFSNVNENVKFVVENSTVKNMLMKINIPEEKIVSLGHEIPVEQFKDNNILYSVLQQAEGNEPGKVQVGNGLYSTTIPDEGSGKFSVPETVKHGGKKYIVVKIGKNAFSYDGESFPWVKDITLPATIKEIGDSAFNDCSSMTKITFAKDSVLDTIGKNAFDGAGLQTIDLPTSVKSIHSGAFKNNRNMKEFSVPENVVSIGDEAFGRMDSLTDIYLPEKLQSVGKNIGLDSTKLKAFHVADGNRMFKDQQGVLFSKAVITLYAYPEGKKDTSFVLPDTVESVEESALAKVQHLQNFKAGKNLKKVKQSAFSNANMLKSVDFSDSRAELENKVFMGCRKLENVILSKHMTQISSYLFSGCSALEEVVLPESIKEIQNGAFHNTPVLASIKVKSVDIELLPKDLNKEGCIYTVASDEIKNLFEKAGVVSSNILVDESLAPQEQAETFVKNNLTYEVTTKAEKGKPGEVRLVETDKHKMGTSLTIPDTVSSHGFAYKVTALGNSAISDNATLEHIDIPKTVTSIGNSAIHGNEKLQSLEIPNTVESIGVNGISDNFEMTSLTFEEDSCLSVLENGALSGNPILLHVTVPKSVKKMGTHVFFWNNSLEKVEFEKDSTIKDIPKGTFFNCFKLQSIVMPQGVESVGEEAFARAEEFTGLDWSNVKRIGERAFWNCKKISKAEFGESLKYIGDGAFANCENLQKVIFKNGIRSIGKMKSDNPEDSIKGAFSSCEKLHEIILPESLKKIGALTFNGCSKLESVTLLQKNIEEIGVGAFGVIAEKAVFHVDNSKVKRVLMNLGNIKESQILVANPDPIIKKKTTIKGLKTAYQLYGSSKTPKNTIFVKGGQNRVAEMQILIDRKWKTVKKSKASGAAGKIELTYPLQWKKYPRSTWRIHIKGTTTFASYTSPPIKITQFAKLTGVKYSYKLKRSKKTLRNIITITPSNVKHKIILQKKTVKGWKKAGLFTNKGKTAVVTFPKSWKKQKKSQWRLYIAETKKTAGYTTKIITVKVQK